MKKSKKILLWVLPVLFMFVFVATGSVFGGAIDPTTPTEGNAIGGVTTLTNNVWSTIKVVVQVAAIAAIVFAGVRYMFASADAKADIKKETITLIVGAILVFAAVPVAQFIADISSTLFTT